MNALGIIAMTHASGTLHFGFCSPKRGELLRPQCSVTGGYLLDNCTGGQLEDMDRTWFYLCPED
jgi:hypothetical protein